MLRSEIPSELHTRDCMPDRFHCPHPTTMANSVQLLPPPKLLGIFSSTEERFCREVDGCNGMIWTFGSVVRRGSDPTLAPHYRRRARSPKAVFPIDQNQLAWRTAVQVSWFTCSGM